MKIAFYTVLQVLGSVVCVLGFAWAMYYQGLEKGRLQGALAYKHVEMPTDEAVLANLKDGTCNIYVKIYGTNAVISLSSGECLIAMGAAGKYLDSRILSGPLGGEKL